MSNETELKALREEVKELRTYKEKWEKAFPGLTPEGVKSMEQQLHNLYQEKDKDSENILSTDYQSDLDNSIKE